MNKLLTKGPLLNEKGQLRESGYAFSLVKQYDRSMIKARWSRIKEWDYYYFGDAHYGVALTIADNSYMSLISASVLDFRTKKQWTKSYMKWFTNGSLLLPSTSKDGDINVEEKDYNFNFYNKNGKRHLVCFLKNLSVNNDFYIDVYLEETNGKSMVKATPFKKAPKCFYYNQKINLLKATGQFVFGPITHKFNKSTYGVLDWGRGVWTYSNTWYWASMSGEYNGHLFGFNLGYGFGDNEAASENMFFYDKEAYKLDDVTFNIPLKDKKEDYLSSWTLTSKTLDINLTFEPLIDRYSNTNALIIQSKQHQVFGKFSGSFTIKNRVYQFKDLIGFAEKVKNRW